MGQHGRERRHDGPEHQPVRRLLAPKDRPHHPPDRQENRRDVQRQPHHPVLDGNHQKLIVGMVGDGGQNTVLHRRGRLEIGKIQRKHPRPPPRHRMLQKHPHRPLPEIPALKLLARDGERLHPGMPQGRHGRDPRHGGQNQQDHAPAVSQGKQNHRSQPAGHAQEPPDRDANCDRAEHHKTDRRADEHRQVQRTALSTQ